MNAVHLGNRLREERRGFEKADGFDARERERRWGADCWDDCSCAHRCAATGDGEKVAPLKNAYELRWSCLGVPQAHTANMRQHDRALHCQCLVERAHEG